MNVVISGPFGYGSLADEFVLAGLLRHLSAAKHDVTVLSADISATRILHDVYAAHLPSPAALLSARGARDAIEKTHLFILAGAGVINAPVPLSPGGKGAGGEARAWLTQFEQIKRIRPDGVSTALMGAGALEIPERIERVRVQRLLHQFCDAISVRDDASKQALISYGLSASRVSMNGDPALALFNNRPDAPEPRRLGIILSTALPSHSGFSPDSSAANAAVIERTRAVVKALFDEVMILVYDQTEPAAAFAGAVSGMPLEDTHSSMAELLRHLAVCDVVVSFSLHGLIAAAALGVPVIGFRAETGAAEFMARIGMEHYLLDDCSADAAASLVKQARAEAQLLRKTIAEKMRILARKEAQNWRMMELLVPRRKRGPKRKLAAGEDEEDFEDE